VADWLTSYTVVDHCGHSITNTVDRAFDGDTATQWTHAVNEAHYVEADLGASYPVYRFRRYKISGGQYNWTNAALYLSDDGVTWGSPVLTFTTTTTANAYSEHTFTSPVVARYMRLVVDTTGIANNIAAAEIQLYAELATVIEATPTPDPYEYEEEPGYRGAEMEAADGTQHIDLIGGTLKRGFVLRYHGLTDAQRAVLDGIYTALAAGYTADNFQSPRGDVYTVTRDPDQRALRWRCQPTANGALYWQTELRLREV